MEMNFEKRRQEMFRMMAIGLSLLFFTVFHYQTVDVHPLLHEVSQRLFYLPIVYAAYRYGFKGGFGAAVVSVLLFMPHLVLHFDDVEMLRNQTAETIMFLVIGIVTGLLSSMQKREHGRYVETAQQLQKAYNDLKETTNQLLLADKLSALGQLSAVLAHEIRNPLASIKGAVEALEAEIPWEHRKRTFLEAIRAEADRLSKLVNEFLQFARPPRLEVLPITPNAVVRSVVALVAKQAASSGIDIRTRFAQELPPIMLDGEQMKQALLNLVINAIQAMPDGGQLELATERAGSTFRISVLDSGPGVPAKIRDRLFDPFVTTKNGGTGLGLAIAQRLVKQHNGTIRATDRQGGGAAFEIEIPLVPSPAEGPALLVTAV
jgi:signal transduction histidine kinase